MPRKRETPEEADILGALRAAKHPLSLRELARALNPHRRGPKQTRAPAQKIPPRPGKNDIRGRLVAHRDGYGFVIPDQPIPGMEGDVFIPPNALSEAMHGDRVWVRLREGRGGRRGGGRAEGTR